MAGLHAVLVGSADISCLVDSVSISHGRDDPGSQPEASSATISLSVDAPDLLPGVVDVGALVAVTSQTAGGTYERFSGRVTDLALGWDEAGADTPDNGVGQIVAVGILAELGRRVVGDTPFPQELDGARVARVMAAAGITLDPLFSDPGTVQLLPRDVDAQQALDVAHSAAVSATGVLWQTRAGLVRYADSDHRRGATAALTLDACDVLVSPTWRRTLEGLVNSVSIGYGPEPVEGDASRYVASNAESIAKWGTYAYSTTTELAALSDAQAQGELLLVRNSSPVWVMAALPVDVAGLDAAQYEALLGLDMHSLVTLTGLPGLGTAPTSAHLWVEGWREELAWGTHELELVVSGYCRTVPPPRWDDVASSWQWDGYTITETRRNRFLNPSATVDATYWQPWNWWGNHIGTGARVPAGDGPPLAGGQQVPFYRVTWTAPHATHGAEAGAQVGNLAMPNSIPVTAGQPVTASGWFRVTGTANQTAMIRATFYGDSSNQDGADHYGTMVAAPNGQWVRVSIQTTVPANSTRVMLGFVTYTAGVPLVPGTTTDLAAVLVEHGTSLAPYFDGDSPDISSMDYAWAGAPGASQSIGSAIGNTGDGVPPSLTWDGATCFGPPTPGEGRWSDQPATLRWDQLAPAQVWDTYR